MPHYKVSFYIEAKDPSEAAAKVVLKTYDGKTAAHISVFYGEKQELYLPCNLGAPPQSEGEWPAYNDIYWYVESWGEVYRGIWSDSETHSLRKKFANCFRTEAEAFAWAEKVRKISNP